MSLSAAIPTDRMRALYQHHAALFGEPVDVIWFDPAEAAVKSLFSRMHVCVWPADADCEVTTFMTLGMSENVMAGPGPGRVELHFAIRASLTEEETRATAGFLASLAEYPFHYGLHLDWWHRLRDAGTIPRFPGLRRLLLRPPFADDACREVRHDGETIRFLYVVPLTEAQSNALTTGGVDGYLDYLVENGLDPLGQPA